MSSFSLSVPSPIIHLVRGTEQTQVHKATDAQKDHKAVFFQFVHQLWSYFDSPGLTLYLLLHMCNPQLYRVANEQGTSSLYRKREKGNSSNPRSDINVIYCKSARISPWLVTIYYSQTNLSPLWSQGSKLSSFVKGVGAFPCALMSFSWPLPKWQYLLLLLFV